jgi:hypothetical protein
MVVKIALKLHFHCLDKTSHKASLSLLARKCIDRIPESSCMDIHCPSPMETNKLKGYISNVTNKTLIINLLFIINSRMAFRDCCVFKVSLSYPAIWTLLQRRWHDAQNSDLLRNAYLSSWFRRAILFIPSGLSAFGAEIKKNSMSLHQKS